MTRLLLECALAFLATAALIPLCKRIAFRFGVVAVPKQDRWHQKPTPLLGGVAMALVVVAGSLAARVPSPVWPALALALALAGVGLVDDVITLKPSTKLVTQIAVASMFLLLDYRVNWTSSLTLDAMLTLVWLVGVTNAFNLLDNMDGLCAGVGLIATAALIADSVAHTPFAPDAHVLVILAGALAGFLIFNLHPASIFMGDTGSLFIGITLAALSLRLADEPQAGGQGLLRVIGAPALLLLIPIFDTTFVTVSRLMAGRRPSQGGRDHSSHRLVAIGLPERAAVRVLWVLAATGAIIGFSLRHVNVAWAATLGAVFVIAMVIFAVFLAGVRVYSASESPTVNRASITPVVADFMYKRRVFEVVLDLCLVAISYYIAYRLRFEGAEYQQQFPRFLESFPLVIAIQIPVLFVFGAYRGAWRYFGLMDGVVFAKAVAVGSVGIITAVVYLHRFEAYSRSVFAIYAMLLMLALMASRASFRLIREFALRRQAGKRLVIYGTGELGSFAARHMLNKDSESYRFVGFIDDDEAGAHTRMNGFTVLGTYSELESLITAGAVDVVVIATGRPSAAQVRELQALCDSSGVVLSRMHFGVEPLVS